jgi:diguanylate cyclase (GGDEF)-like protein
VAVAHLDVDRFSVVNHAWSPAVGDAVLRGVGDRLRALIRDGDVLARLHGDSFGFLLTGLRTDEQVHAFAERVARRLGRPFALHGREIELTASIGVSWYPDHGADAETLLRHADAAMYRAKEAGRNRTLLYRPTMNTRVAERLALEQGLRRAIGSNELLLYYQPIVEVATGRIVRFEALLRWNHPERGLLPPAQFLPLAEPIGLADAVDQWVLRTACSEALRWRSLVADHPPRVSVTLTPRSFQQPDLIQRVDTVLGDTGLPASALEIEITESTAMGDAEATLAVLRQLKASGVRLAIDDYGTGSSSLSSLRTFPIDTLKIDRAFVRDLGREPTAPALIAGIVALAKSLGLEVVAEGIETEEQRAIVQAEGCQLLQGFLLGMPMPAAECAALVAAQGLIPVQDA